MEDRSNFYTLSFEEKVELFIDMGAKPNILKFPIDYKYNTSPTEKGFNYGRFYLRI